MKKKGYYKSILIELDDEDTKILLQSEKAFISSNNKIKTGDFVRSLSGELRRVAYVYPSSYPRDVQTCKTGSFFLGDGWMSMSGSLDDPISEEYFVKTSETMLGDCWFFHHNYTRAYNSVSVQIKCPVWQCQLKQIG